MTVYQLPFPLSTTPRNGYFGALYTDTGQKRRVAHGGHDFARPSGTPYPAVADGAVAAKGHSSLVGYWIEVAHDDGVYSSYAHSEKASPLNVGDRVRRGQTLNGVGAGGQVTGPHLHLALSTVKGGGLGGRSFDPIPYITARSTSGSGAGGFTPIEEIIMSTVAYVKNAEGTGIGAHSLITGRRVTLTTQTLDLMQRLTIAGTRGVVDMLPVEMDLCRGIFELLNPTAGVDVDALVAKLDAADDDEHAAIVAAIGRVAPGATAAAIAAEVDKALAGDFAAVNLNIDSQTYKVTPA